MLVGRGSERAAIDSLLADARGGRSGTLVLRGEPGIGKTALVEYAVERAGDFQVLRAAGVESESELAFSALHELLRPVLTTLDAIPASQADALRAALALTERVHVDRFRVYAATLSLLAEVAETTPLLCAVDDAQWIDFASAESLVFTARRCARERIAFVFAAREGEARAFDAPALPDLRLTGLHREAAEELLARRSAGVLAPDVTERVVELSGGNPLALLEMPEALADAQLAGADVLSGPLPIGKTIEEAFLRRIRNLTTETATALLVAAASEAGDAATVHDALSELGVAADALEGAERSGLIKLESGRLAFRHPLVRSAVYQGADAVERRRAHRALATVLERSGLHERYPWHLAAAAIAPDEAIATALDEAARTAGERAGFASQSYAYERAARMTPDPVDRTRRLLKAAEAAWAVGLDRVEALCREALTLTDAPELRGEIHAQLETALYWRGDLLAAHAVKEQTAAELEPVAPVQAAHMRARATASLRHFLRGANAVDTSRRAYELMRSAGGEDPRVPAMYAQALARAGALEEAMALAHGCRAAVEAAPDTSLRANLAEVFELADDFDSADALRGPWVQGQSGLAARDPSTLSHALERQARIEQLRGRLHAGYASAAQSVDVAALVPDELLQRAESSARLAILLAHRGEGGARAEAALALDFARLCGSRALEAEIRSALGLLELSLGRTDEAIAELEVVREMVRSGGYRHPAFIQFSPELVEALVRADRRADAAAELAELEAEVAAARTPWSLAVAARCRGLLAEGTEFERRFEDALANHGQSPRVLERARTQLAYGERLRRAGERVRAREQLRAAFAAFETAGAEAWAARARNELEASGQRLRRQASGRETLTPQEIQVALTVARGATNKEVAAALFLSTKTVEFHLRNVYRKLGVRSRTELARSFGETTGSPPLAS